MKKKILFIFIILLVFIGFYFINIEDNNTTKVINYNGNKLRISIDGVSSEYLPSESSYYLSSYDCKSSNTKIYWDRDSLMLDITNGNKKGGVSCNLEFKTNPLLSEMEPGSYVKYIGNNGCEGNSCEGYNANYVSDTDMGYCNSNSYKFHVNGWRIGYIENGSAHLVSAGALECMCTGSDGIAASSGCSGSLTAGNISNHINNMNGISLKYCNANYIKNGVCDSSTAWAMNAVDFSKITGSTLSSGSCYGSSVSNKFACGYTNDLIDNGSFYWFATPYSASSATVFYWYPGTRYVYASISRIVDGVRPVLYLESSVVVISGSGTYEDPYVIGNNTFSISDTGNVVDDDGNITSVVLNMKAVGTSVSKMCISVNTAVCTNYVDFNDTYTLDLTGYGTGEKVIYAYYKDSNDKIIATMNKSITLS